MSAVSHADQASGCQACRIRHLSCDRGSPSCRRCRASGRPCTQRFNVRFSSRRNWVPPVRSPSPSSPQSDDPPTPRQNQHIRAASELSQRSTRSARSEASQWSSQSQNTVEALPADDTSHDVIHHSPVIPEESPRSGNLTCRNEISSSPLLKLTSEDADFIQYFGDSIGRSWFDHTDSDFTLEALRIAPSSPVLCYSILAVSSFYHCKITGIADGRADFFHRKAVDILVELMCDPVKLSDGAGLASVVILRLYEESKARNDGQDAESHLLAGRVFAATIANNKQSTTKLARAAFWIHQRQDVFHSISQQKPTRTSLDVTHLWEPGDSYDIYTWTKRSQKIAGETADFCFGDDDTEPREQRFKELQLALAQLWEFSWPTFEPLLFVERDVRAGRILPEIRFSLSTCLTGYVHLRLSQLLLAMYNPSSLTLGPQAINRHKEMEIEVQTHVRVLCGVARYNACPIGKVIACLAITLGLDFFSTFSYHTNTSQAMDGFMIPQKE